MDLEIITIFCICDDIIKSLKIKEDSQIKMSIAEVLTTAITAAMFFGGNHERARSFMKEYEYIPNMLSKSQFNRRLHTIEEYVWQTISFILGQVFKQRSQENEFIVDSMPVPVCDNIRIARCKIYRNEKYRGFIASKRRYFYGIRIHMIQTISREPIEFTLLPGAISDIKAFKMLNFDLPEKSSIYADGAYNDYEFEDLLQEAAQIRLIPQRKSNSKRPFNCCINFLNSFKRKAIETGFSGISSLFAKSIHAVTAVGFELKIVLFILAYSFKML